MNRTKKYNTKPNHQWGQRFQNSDSPPTYILVFITTCIPLSTTWILLFFVHLNIPTGVPHVFILMVTFARVIVIAWKPKWNPGTRNILITCYNCCIHLNSWLDLMCIIYYHNRFWHYCTTPFAQQIHELLSKTPHWERTNAIQAHQYSKLGAPSTDAGGGGSVRERGLIGFAASGNEQNQKLFCPFKQARWALRG